MRRLLPVAIVVLGLLGVAVVPIVGVHWLGWSEHPEAVPEPARKLEIGEGRYLNVRELGSGSPVVLVHGLPSSIQDWGETPEKLADMGHRVVVYDRIGYGHSSRDPVGEDTYSYESNVEDLRALLDALGIERAALVGWSYGGAVVQRFAELHPGRVSHVALIGSVGPSLAGAEDGTLEQIVANPLAVEILEWVSAFPALAETFTQTNLELAFNDPEAIPPGFLERTIAMLALPGTLDAYVAEARHEQHRALDPEEVEVPTLVLHGNHDRLVPAAVGEDLEHRIPDATLLLVPEGSHMLPVTHPDLTAGAIDALIRQNPSDG